MKIPTLDLRQKPMLKILKREKTYDYKDTKHFTSLPLPWSSSRMNQ